MTAAERAPFVLADAGVTATKAESFGPDAFDVPPESWIAAHEAVRDELGMLYFDWLTASDELADGFRVVSHVVAFHGPGEVEHLLLRTLVPRAEPTLATLTSLYAGANWHERETYEMFGIGFDGHPNLVPLLLPDGFEGNPLRKEFVLASRVAKPWPGAKEPGESEHAPKAGAPSRRRTLPPGVPDPETWGPRPPGSPEPDPLAAALASAAPARPTRRAPGDRPARRDRSAGTPQARAATEAAPSAADAGTADRGRGGDDGGGAGTGVAPDETAPATRRTEETPSRTDDPGASD